MARRIILALTAVAILTTALLGGACRLPSRSGTVEDAFRGRTLRIIVGVAAGGGYDLHARVMSDFLSRHIPGRPAVVVETMSGAGGLIATNYLARQARPDGLTLGFVGLFAVLPQVMGQEGVQYDARQFEPIGAPTYEEADLCLVTRESGISLANWRSRAPLPRLGATIRGSNNHTRAVLLTAALDLPARFVVGYKGTSELRLAMESGEIDGTCVGVNSYLATFATTGKYAIAFQSGEGTSPVLDGVPSAARLRTSERGRSLLDVLAGFRLVDRFYVAPPGTPAASVDALRDAFDATMRDEEFLARAREARLEIRPITGRDVSGRVARMMDLPDATRRDLVALLNGGQDK